MLGNQWGPLIVNSLDEMNVSLLTNMDPVIDMCDREDRVLIGGRANDGYHFSYFLESSKYVTSNSGKHKLAKSAFFYEDKKLVMML